MVVLGQKWFSSGKSGCIREKRLYSGKSCCGPTATVTSLKVTMIEGPDKGIQGKRLSSRIYAADERSCPFSKLQKLLIFDILAKGGPHENFLESFIFTNA